ncbi:MAG: hypothetical protein JNJ73_02285 [Hyphomonadaceae bacterium]|nr:hypothetical protein [Hyphomonadaceae bacterium]
MPSRRMFALALCALFVAAPPAWSAAAKAKQDPNRSRSLTSAESYLPMPTLNSAVVGRFAPSGILVVDVGLDIPDSALRARAAAATPRLRDALRTALATYANTYYRDQTAPDPTTIARLMQAAVDRTLGAPGARLLLANVVYQHRAR